MDCHLLHDQTAFKLIRDVLREKRSRLFGAFWWSSFETMNAEMSGSLAFARNKGESRARPVLLRGFSFAMLRCSKADCRGRKCRYPCMTAWLASILCRRRFGNKRTCLREDVVLLRNAAPEMFRLYHTVWKSLPLPN